jgi:hypothetical protein
MPVYFIEYQLDDTTSLQVMAPEDYRPSGPVKAGTRGESESENVIKAKQRFGEALEAVKLAGLGVLEKLHDLQADEVELKFGLVTTGELGNFAIGKVGIEANYEVTLKWAKKPDTGRQQKMALLRRRALRRKTWLK